MTFSLCPYVSLIDTCDCVGGTYKPLFLLSHAFFRSIIGAYIAHPTAVNYITCIVYHVFYVLYPLGISVAVAQD